MVEVITIGPDLAGKSEIDLPDFAGYDLIVSRRGIGWLTDAVYELSVSPEIN